MYTLGRQLLILASTSSVHGKNQEIGKTISGKSFTILLQNKHKSKHKNKQDIRDYQINHHPGYLRAYFSTLRSFKLAGLDSDYQLVNAAKDIPVHVLWV